MMTSMAVLKIMKYIKDRLRYLEQDGLNEQVQENMWQSLKERGIGGVQNFQVD